MISEADIEDKAYTCVLDDLANKVFTVSNHIIEGNNNINDSRLSTGWHCILNDIGYDLCTLKEAMENDKKKGGKKSLIQKVLKVGFSQTI